MNLAERIGSYGFAFITRGHVHDTAVPGWVESDDSINFLREVLDLDPLDIAAKFEQWACAKKRGKLTSACVVLFTDLILPRQLSKSTLYKVSVPNVLILLRKGSVSCLQPIQQNLSH